ncbi:hypothetical protein N2152v2_002199 [Parachlorella kessleri]
MPPTNGSVQRAQEFPPRWLPSLLRRTFSVTKNLLAVGAGFLSYTATAAARDAYKDGQLQAAWGALLQRHTDIQLVYLLAAGALAALALLAVALRAWRKQPIYLLDFECYRPDPSLNVRYDRFMKGSEKTGWFDKDALDFQERILNKSALSGETFFPPALFLEPPVINMETARQEAELVLYPAVEELLRKTGIKPRQVDVLVTNCSLFNPTPSLSAMIINHFKMRADIDSYHLGGMGCSAGVIAIGLAQKLLRERGSGGYALVVSTENITQNWYRGNDRSMLIPNCIFRMGSAAILLTNKRSERRRAKYSLEHVVRVHLGADDTAFQCVYQKPDAQGHIGVELSRDLVKVAAKALTTNMTRLGPLVLPWSEKLAFAANWVARQLPGGKRVAAYVPDFKQAFNHFCLHAGGRGVVEGLSKQLGLSARQMSPSANALYWYGNTSSSTVWYSFGFIESVQGVRRGDVVWQVGFGSGFKCNSAVWRALRPIKQVHGAWAHIRGRESEALDTLLALGKEKDEKPKAAKEPVVVKADEPSTSGSKAGGDSGSSSHQEDNNKENDKEGSEAANNGRVLRNGKVVVAANCN